MKKRDNIISQSFFKELFKEQREFFSFVKIIEPQIAMDGSSYQATIEVMSDGDETLCDVGFLSGCFTQVEKGDIYLACFINGNRDACILISYITNEKKPLHPKVVAGDTVLSCLKGKKIHFTNNSNASLTEPSVLGNKIMSWLGKLSDEIKNIGSEVDSLKDNFNAHVHLSAAPGSPTATPTTPSTVSTSSARGKIDELNANDTKNENLSDLVFIQERGLL